MPWWAGLIIGVVIGILIGGIAAFFLVKRMFEKQIENNSPVNPNMIRTLYGQLGRKPSEAQIQAIINSNKKRK